MAKASKETIIVKPAQEAITEDVIHLQLSKEEAQAVFTILMAVGGDPDNSDRKYIQSTVEAMEGTGVYFEEKALSTEWRTITQFKDWSEYKEAMPDAIAEKQEFKFKLGERVWIPDFADFGNITELPTQYSKLYTVRTEYFIHCFSESEIQHAPSNR